MSVKHFEGRIIARVWVPRYLFWPKYCCWPLSFPGIFNAIKYKNLNGYFGQNPKILFQEKDEDVQGTELNKFR